MQECAISGGYRAGFSSIFTTSTFRFTVSCDSDMSSQRATTLPSSIRPSNPGPHGKAARRQLNHRISMAMRLRRSCPPDVMQMIVARPIACS
jgi:hypothetical protein